MLSSAAAMFLWLSSTVQTRGLSVSMLISFAWMQLLLLTNEPNERARFFMSYFRPFVVTLSHACPMGIKPHDGPSNSKLGNILLVRFGPIKKLKLKRPTSETQLKEPEYLCSK